MVRRCDTRFFGGIGDSHLFLRNTRGYAKSGDRHAFQTAEKRVSPRFSLSRAAWSGKRALPVFPAKAKGNRINGEKRRDKPARCKE